MVITTTGGYDVNDFVPIKTVSTEDVAWPVYCTKIGFLFSKNSVQVALKSEI